MTMIPPSRGAFNRSRWECSLNTRSDRSQPDPAVEPAVLILPRAVQVEMIEHARRELPREAVGLVAGNERLRATAVLPLVNRIERHAFFADPYSQYQAYQRIKAEGLTTIAVYHSHPFGGPNLSDVDVHVGERNRLLQIVIAMSWPQGAETILHAYTILDGIPWQIPVSED